jgi:hypothetical protein
LWIVWLVQRVVSVSAFVFYGRFESICTQLFVSVSNCCVIYGFVPYPTPIYVYKLLEMWRSRVERAEFLGEDVSIEESVLYV